MERKLLIGMDVSKSSLDFVELKAKLPWSAVSKLPVKRLDNTIPAITALAMQYPVEECIFVLEPTGSYSDKVLECLSQLGHHVCLVGTRAFNSYCQFLGIDNKHDQQAARTLAHIAQVSELPRYEPASTVLKTRKKICSTLEALQKDQQRLKNRIHAEEQYLSPCELVLETFQEMLDLVTRKIDLLQKQLTQLRDEQFEQAQKLAQSVVGIGKVTSELLSTLTNGFNNFEHAKQVVKFCGLAPRSHKSGSSINSKKSISKQANAQLRRALYMAAITACRFNHACKDLYQRLRARGKGHYKAIVAVMAKLVRQVFAVVKSQNKVDNLYQAKFI